MLGALAALCALLLPAPLAAQLNQAERDAFVIQHNAVRAGVSPPATPALPAVSWSATIEATAQTWANNCLWQHSGTPGLGENMYATTFAGATPANVVGNWAAEAASYNYAANTCSGVCGHYTQVVWRGSTSIGCGKKTCNPPGPFDPPFDDLTWYIWVCQYSPPGNFIGQRPYLCDYDGNGTYESVCDFRVLLSSGFESGVAVPPWSGKHP